MNLRDIAANQQNVVSERSGRGAANLGIGKDGKLQLNTKGKFSFDSNPTQPPWVSMPDGGIPFSSNGTITTPGITGGPPYTWTDVIGPNGQYIMQVPNGYDGVIRKLVCFYNGGGFISGSGQLIWRILADGQAIRNYDNILVQLGVAPFNGDTEGIRLKSNQTVQFQVTNVGLSGGGSQVFCQFVGWYYPCKLS